VIIVISFRLLQAFRALFSSILAAVFIPVRRRRIVVSQNVRGAERAANRHAGVLYMKDIVTYFCAPLYLSRLRAICAACAL